MIKDIEYKGIKYQELDNPSQLKLKVRKLIQNNDIDISEIQKVIRSEERKKEVMLSVNLPVALVFPSVLAGILASYCLNRSHIIWTVIIVTVYLVVMVCLYIIGTNKWIKRYDNKIDLCEKIKNILQKEDNAMEKDVREKDIVNEEKEQVLSTIKIENTCIKEYLEIVKEEYQIERAKRQSFESRVGIIITILTALCVFVFDKIQIKDIVKLMIQDQCSFFNLIQIITGGVAYGGFIIALLCALKIINVRKYSNFNVAAIKEGKMGKPVIEGCIELVNSYKKIILDHREENENKAKYMKRAYISIFVAIIAIIIYVNIK